MLCVLTILLAFLWTTVVGARDLYVSPQGNDASSGTWLDPFATLAHARDQARRSGNGPHRILLLEGVHYLREPLLLGPEDSGLTIQAATTTEPVISGGCRVVNWRPHRAGILEANLAALRLPDLNFHELYYNSKLMAWARVPNFDPAHPRTGGFLQNAEVVEVGTKTKFRYPEGALHPERWAHPEQAWIVFHDSLNYETQYCPVKNIDSSQRIVEAKRGVYVLTKGNPFYLCGILEELDAPGEWCVDPSTSTLYFLPPEGNPNGPDQVIIPVAKSAFVLTGKAEEGQWVERVHIRGLALRDFRGPAIQLTGAKDCTVAKCDLRNAEVGVSLGDDTHSCRILGCDITQTQGDGVSILGTTLDHERVSDHVVNNCYIWNIGWGRIHNRCGGVYMHRCCRCKLTHNHVHDSPRYALAMDVGNDCEFAYNYCHHVNLVTADSGIIEAATAMDWRMTIEEQRSRHKPHNWGNTVHHNLLHDSGGWGTNTAGELVSPYFTWGIYLDLDCSGWRIYDNVVYNTVLGGFMLNGGVDNVVENNIFVDGQQSQIQWNPWRDRSMSGNRCERNIFAYRGGTATVYTLNGFKDEFVTFVNNLIWAGGQRPTIKGLPGVSLRKSWEGWLARGQDQGSLLADPQFIDAERRDYRLKPTSPAFTLGFREIDLSEVGNYASPDRHTWPRPEVQIVRDVLDYTASPSRPKQPILRNYEDYVVGETERNAHVGIHPNLSAVEVTDETAASGRHSLRVTEKPGLEHVWEPYITYMLDVSDGIMHAAFALCVEKGAEVVYEWRDDPYSYNLGPQLRIAASGLLTANGRPLMELPVSEWVHFEIECPLGEKADGTYELTVKVPHAEAHRFANLPCAVDFDYLSCVVIMSMAEDVASFYLDDIEFRRQPPAE
ncbi:MAG: right-handed parallel beta-helix repeat-containing protein [Candidatus Zipacnadales bacterium]